MTVYFDSSVILRKVLGQPASLEQWDEPWVGCSSVLTRLECARTLDRARLAGPWTADALMVYQTATNELLSAVDEIEITTAVLARGRMPLTVPLGTLDALHLSTAMIWRDQNPEDEFAFATHDRALGRVARLMGLTVIGIE